MLDHKAFIETIWAQLGGADWAYVWHTAEILNTAVCQSVGRTPSVHFTRKTLHDLINPQDLPSVLWDLKTFSRTPGAAPLKLQYRLRQMSGHYEPVTEFVRWEPNGQILSSLRLSADATAKPAILPAISEQNSPLETFLSAWRDDRLLLAYQPVIDSKTNQPVFYECLMRLETPDGNVLPASTFIQTVEANGLTRLIDMTCLRLALKELRAYPQLQLSINAATATFTDPEWIRFIEDNCREDYSVASRLIVEITEHDLMTDIEGTCQTLNRLRQMGIRTALDDFGAGQTSLRHLVQLPLNILKFDRRFTSQMSLEHSNLFVGNLQNLAQGLGLTTVAEGAESLDDVNRLQKLGVHLIQGYAVGMPSLSRAWAKEAETKQAATPVKRGSLRSIK